MILNYIMLSIKTPKNWEKYEENCDNARNDCRKLSALVEKLGSGNPLVRTILDLINKLKDLLHESNIRLGRCKNKSHNYNLAKKSLKNKLLTEKRKHKKDLQKDKKDARKGFNDAWNDYAAFRKVINWFRSEIRKTLSELKHTDLLTDKELRKAIEAAYTDLYKHIKKMPGKNRT